MNGRVVEKRYEAKSLGTGSVGYPGGLCHLKRVAYVSIP